LVFTNTVTNIIASVRRITIADWVACVVQAFPAIAAVIVHAAFEGANAFTIRLNVACVWRRTSTFTGSRIRRYRDAGIVARAFLILASAIAIFATLEWTDAFTIVLLVARVLCWAIAFTGRGIRRLSGAGIVARAHLICTGAIIIFTTFVGTDALTICVHVASVHFGTIALTNWIAVIV
jgi:hypothetical protein